MKRLISLLLVTILSVALLSGCTKLDLKSGEDSQNETTATEKTEKTVYENTLDDVISYMSAKSYIKVKDEKKDWVTMRADMVGAEKGYSFESNSTTAEIYQFNTDKLNDTAQRIIDEVKSSGSFSLYDENLELEGHLTSDGKFLFAYVATGDSDNDAGLEEAGNYFEQFYPEG